MQKISLMLSFLLLSGLFVSAQEITIQRNKPERVEWFRELGFGMFIHWSMDVQLGTIISHNVAAASREYQDRYFNQLPKTFYPKKFDPDEWAVLAELAGMKYVVFTAKHHSGFCMWDSATTEFDIMNTAYGKDAMAEIIKAFRARGIAIGLYFSPDDFHVMYKQGRPISRRTEAQKPENNPELVEITRKQITEILTKYGKIDILFLDEKEHWVNTVVANYCWDIDPDVVITRGGMATPEQHLPDEAIPGPWEACITMGWQWQYVPELHKDGTELINMLIETRAKGGNLLLNVGPKANGELPEIQQDRLREIALWYFTNQEAITDIEPWEIVKADITPDTHDSRKIKNIDRIWYTKSKKANVVYAFLPGENWVWKERKEFLLRNVKANDNTRVSLLGQSQDVMEYAITTDPRIHSAATEEGLFVSVIKAQRLNKRWDNPLVLKIENAEFQEVPAYQYKEEF